MKSIIASIIGKVLPQTTVDYYTANTACIKNETDFAPSRREFLLRYVARESFRQTAFYHAGVFLAPFNRKESEYDRMHREMNRPGRINELYGSMGRRDTILTPPRPSQILLNSLKHMVP